MRIGLSVGLYAGKILHDAKPADLPVQQSTKLELTGRTRRRGSDLAARGARPAAGGAGGRVGAFTTSLASDHAKKILTIVKFPGRALSSFPIPPLKLHLVIGCRNMK
jgi:hypothetical protein